MFDIYDLWAETCVSKVTCQSKQTFRNQRLNCFDERGLLGTHAYGVMATGVNHRTSHNKDTKELTSLHCQIINWKLKLEEDLSLSNEQL